MSDLVGRIQREIRERLDASRAAVREHERLEAALHASGDAGSRATRAVRGHGRSAVAARPSSPAAKPSTSEARPSKRSPAGTKRGAAARAGSGATARAPKRSDATGRDRRQPARRRASSSAPAAGPKRGARAAGPVAPARKRAPRGANREAVLRVVGERPGVTARELAAASQVTGGTLHSLLRRLRQEGTLETRELPGGQTGYVVAASAPAAPRAAEPQPASTTSAQEGENRTSSADMGGARSVPSEAQATGERDNERSDIHETSARDAIG